VAANHLITASTAEPDPDLAALSVGATAGATDNSAAIGDIYRRWGCVLLRGFFDTGELAPLRDELRALMNLLRVKAGLPVAGPAPDRRFDHGFLELVERDPEAEKALFDACRRLPAVHRLSVAEKPMALAQGLMGAELLMVNPYKTVRIDYRQREDYLLPWHQDYPYVQDSIDALILWIPLHDVGEDNGCPMLAPGSHRGGIQPVRMRDAGACGKHLDLADPEAAGRYPNLRVPLRAGDVLVFSTLTLHRSCRNLTPDPRWTLQLRYGNYADPFVLSRHWPCSHYELNWFDRRHAEYVVGPD
jgi:hypothetical protein